MESGLSLKLFSAFFTSVLDNRGFLINIYSINTIMNLNNE